MQNKVYIVGSEGWAGKTIKNKFCELGINVKCGDLAASSKDECYDFSDNSACREFFDDYRQGDILISCMGIVHPKLLTSSFTSGNLYNNIKVISAFLERGDAQLYYLSSNSCFGFNESNRAFNEKSEYRPYQKYGRSKMQMEQWIQTNVQNYCILRVPWFHGPNMPSRQVTFYNKVATNKFPIFGSGNNKRSIVSTSTIAKAILAHRHKYTTGKYIYWLADVTKTQYEINLNIFNCINSNRDRKFTPKYASSYICFLCRKIDTLLQTIFLYNKIIHVIGEMDQDIFCETNLFQDEFPDFAFQSLSQIIEESK